MEEKKFTVTSTAMSLQDNAVAQKGDVVTGGQVGVENVRRLVKQGFLVPVTEQQDPVEEFLNETADEEADEPVEVKEDLEVTAKSLLESGKMLDDMELTEDDVAYIKSVQENPDNFNFDEEAVGENTKKVLLEMIKALNPEMKSVTQEPKDKLVEILKEETLMYIGELEF